MSIKKTKDYILAKDRLDRARSEMSKAVKRLASIQRDNDLTRDDYKSRVDKADRLVLDVLTDLTEEK